ncbi:MAG: GGDEF domain-containing protein [Chloroflexota bacterium]
MLLNWRKKPAVEASETLSPEPSSEVTIADFEAGSQALDSLANLVRIYSQYTAGLSAAETAALQRDCEAWARHVLTCAPSPGAEHGPSGERDWGGLRSFFQTRRKQESEHVSKSITDLRQAIWTFIDGLSTALTQDQDIDSKVVNQLDALRLAVETPSTEDLKKAVLGAVSTLSDLVEERKQRQDERMYQLGSKVSELSEELQEVRKESALDGLTKLFTRKPFEDYLTKAAYLRKVFGQPCCLLMIDLDHFKEINDAFGHPVGDKALKTVSDCLVRSFPRRSDFVSRFGGDEFAVILSGTTLNEAVRLADRFAAVIRSTPLPDHEPPVKMTVSVGVAELARGEAADSWLARADSMLYEAKRAGRDRVVGTAPGAATAH